MVAILREYGTERMLVNSAADWGNSDPLKTRKTGQAMLAAGFTERRRRPRAVAQPGRVLRAERPAAARPGARVRRARAARRGRHLRGQLGAPRGAGLMPMHLSYCTNVHPAEDLDGVLAPARRVRRAGAPARRPRRARRRPVAARRPRRADSPRSAADRHRLRATARRERPRGAHPQRLPVPGVPRRVVKLDVYRPDWTDPRRARYTLDCAAVLADLLPDGAAGSISTLPLGVARPVDRRRRPAGDRGARTVSRELRALRGATGRTVRVAIEPEPGCVLDTVADVVGWLDRAHAVGVRTIDRIDPEFVGVCLDTCHLAVSFADPADAVRRIGAAGLRVVKVQASAALHVERPVRRRRAATRWPRSSNRATCTRPARCGPTARWPPPTTSPRRSRPLPTDGPWRVHFHVPLHLAPAPPLTAHDRRARGRPRRGPRAPHGDEATSTSRPTPGPCCPTRRRRPRRRHRRRARAGPREHLLGPRRTRTRGIRARRPCTRRCRMTSTLLLDVVGLTPRALAHMPRLRALATSGAAGPLGTVLPAVTCSVQSTILTGLAPARARHRRQRLVLPRPRRGAPVAPAQRAGAGREGLGDRPARPARLHRRQRLLVVRDGREHRHHRHAATDLPRRRPQGARLLHAPARPARRADRRARRVPAVPVLGADRVDRLDAGGSSRRPARSCATALRPA